MNTENNPSIQRLLKGHYTVIVAVLFTLALFFLFLGWQINLQYEKILDTNLYFNNYQVAVEELEQALELTFLYEGGDYSADYYEAAEKLEHAARQIGTVTHPAIWRTATDLSHLAQSYLYHCHSSVSLKWAGFDDAAVPTYRQARETKKMVDDYFSQSYRVLIDLNDNTRETAENFRFWCIVIGVLVGVVVLMCSHYLVETYVSAIVTPIVSLTTQISKPVLAGQMEEAIQPVSCQIQEINAMTVAFHGYLRQLQQASQLEKQLLEEETKNLRIQNLLKASELKALQSRINPHFLFNSLNMITSFAYLEQAEQTTRLMEALGSYLRYNLDKFNKTVTIADEVDNITDYLSLQKMRMGQRLQFQVDCDPEARMATIPCLVLQPLVENSIMHGIHNYLKDGHIRVSIVKQGEHIVVSVSDNGDGMEEPIRKKLELLGKTDHIAENNDHIGVQNVFSRLRLFYDGDIKISITSVPGVKTTFVLQLPYWKQEVNTSHGI